MDTKTDNIENLEINLPAGDAVVEKLFDALVPGYQVEFDPDEAEQAGAFLEDALSEDDALESALDLAAEWEEGEGE